jgi:ribA/ribD-fused uncharacterized protein
MSSTSFNKEGEENGYLSNYFGKKEDKSFVLMMHGFSWKTSEHYFQSVKFMWDNIPSRHYAENIMKAKTPNMAKILANQKKAGGYKWRTDLNPIIEEWLLKGATLRPDWESYKDSFMKDVVLEKFKQNSVLSTKLLSTGDSIIVEHSKDKYWGDGMDGTGKNKLGNILVEVRSFLRKHD